MKKEIIVISMLMATSFGGQVYAEEGKGNIGLASKSLVIGVTNSLNTTTYVWAGAAITAGYDITDYISVNGATYTLFETANTNSKMTGFEADVRFGPNSKGFTYFGSLGYFSDTWNGSTSGLSQKYSGGSLGAGIGYNWENVNLNWKLFSLRSASDYQGASTSDYLVNSSTLALAYRF